MFVWHQNYSPECIINTLWQLFLSYTAFLFLAVIVADSVHRIKKPSEDYMFHTCKLKKYSSQMPPSCQKNYYITFYCITMNR